MSAISLADARIAELLAAIDRAGMHDRATVFVTSDHGFKEVRRQIKPNAALRLVGLVEANGTQVTACDLWVVAEGGTAMVYVTNPERRAELVVKAKELLGGLEGVDRVFEPAEFAAMGLPRAEENDQAPDLLLAAKSGYAFDSSPEGEPLVILPPGAYVGTHGYVSSDPEMNSTLIAWGYGIRRGARAENVNNIDLAPTVAALMGVPLPSARGRVLTEILK
jgi:arylsulfatase A-like enzyme